MKDKMKQEIIRLVNRFSRTGDKDLFAVELEHLVLEAKRIQMQEDHEDTMAILRGRV